jgi:Domain of unknown function (DUF4338)
VAWSEEARKRNVHLLAYNPRYLILPWVQVEHLASHLLGRMAVAMLALPKYGTGVPFNRLERLQQQLGMKLPATTQWNSWRPPPN